MICRTISDLLFAPAISSEDLDILEYAISSFVKLFQQLFPGKTVPKLHFLLHYVTQIRKLGPLRHLWCMRFEGKHQYFKRIAHQLCNFRNVAYSLAKRHQLRLCWEYMSTDFLQREPAAENATPKSFSSYTRDVQQALLDFVLDISEDSTISEEEIILSCKTLRLNTVKYSEKDCFIVDISHTEEVPVFFKIIAILNLRSKWLLYGCIYVSSTFNKHMHAYEVESIDCWSVIEAGQEIDHHALDLYSHNEKNFIVMHHKPYRY